MIEVKNISFKYAGSKHLVFDDFSLKLEEDRIYGLLGKNGTGKSSYQDCCAQLAVLCVAMVSQQKTANPKPCATSFL